MAMKLAITENEGEFAVWAMLDDADFNPDPTKRHESFIVGIGPTVVDALQDAERELDRTAGELAVMLHDARLGLPIPVANSRTRVQR
jgi:hypothetical protein